MDNRMPPSVSGLRQWLLPDQLFDGTSLRADTAVLVVDGRIKAIVPAQERPDDAECQKLSGIISPGFVDIQVNGGGGVQFNNDPTVAGIATIARAHRDGGTLHWFPTCLTDAPAVLAKAADAVIACNGAHGVAGLHVEGPHISVVRRGTHAPAHIRPFDATTLAQVARVRDAGIPVLITLAPEAATAKDVAALVALGAVVSIGHSDAEAADVAPLLDAGASMFTHLFNAMSPMVNRAPGVTGAAINSSAFCSIIVDGHHVADEMVALACRARPVPGRMIAITDAMATVGGPDRFDLYGTEISLKGGKLINAEGSLAGAHITMLQSVARLEQVIGLSRCAALRMATAAPAEAMNLPGEQGRLVVGGPARFLLLSNEMDHARIIETCTKA